MWTRAIRPYACAAVLTQNVGDQIDKPVSFASVRLTPTQRNWSTVEKEAFACIWALKKYQKWLFRSKVTTYSDHNPLTFLTQASSQSSNSCVGRLPGKSLMCRLNIKKVNATQPRTASLGLGCIYPSQQSRLYPRLCCVAVVYN